MPVRQVHPRQRLGPPPAPPRPRRSHRPARSAARSPRGCAGAMRLAGSRKIVEPATCTVYCDAPTTVARMPCRAGETAQPARRSSAASSRASSGPRSSGSPRCRRHELRHPAREHDARRRGRLASGGKAHEARQRLRPTVRRSIAPAICARQRRPRPVGVSTSPSPAPIPASARCRAPNGSSRTIRPRIVKRHQPRTDVQRRARRRPRRPRHSAILVVPPPTSMFTTGPPRSRQRHRARPMRRHQRFQRVAGADRHELARLAPRTSRRSRAHSRAAPRPRSGSARRCRSSSGRQPRRRVLPRR